jgi:hypothetical protein
MLVEQRVGVTRDVGIALRVLQRIDASSECRDLILEGFDESAHGKDGTGTVREVRPDQPGSP